MYFHNTSQDHFGVTTNLMNLLKSYLVCKKLGLNLVMYNDCLMNLNFESDVNIQLKENFFNGVSVDFFRSMKTNPDMLRKFILNIHKSWKNGKKCEYISAMSDFFPTGEDVDYLFYYEWFPKVGLVDSSNFSLRIKINEPNKVNFNQNTTVFHVKNKSLLNVNVDVEITDFVMSRYIHEFNPTSISFVGGCQEMKTHFCKKYGVEDKSHVHYRPLYHREKGNLDSVLSDIYFCAKTNFVTNDFLHGRYYPEISEKYINVPNELCFYNSMNYTKHIFDRQFHMSNYFDLFVVLQKEFNFIKNLYDSQ